LSRRTLYQEPRPLFRNKIMDEEVFFEAATLERDRMIGSHETNYGKTEVSSTVPLDKIEHAGCVQMNRLAQRKEKFNRNWFSFAMDISLKKVTFLSILIDPEVTCHLDTMNGRFASEFQQLEEARVLQQSKRRELRFHWLFFTILKSIECSRAIFNGKHLAKFWSRPRPVGLPTIPDLLKALSRFRRPFIYQRDYRHWFYQIPLSNHHFDYFGINFSSTMRYFMKVLPMGWSWSPFIAQSIASFIAAQAMMDVFGEAFRMPTSEEIPPWYEHTEGTTLSMVIVWYDNFCILSDDPTIAARIIRAVDAMSAKFGAIYKTKKGEDLMVVQEASTIFLGIELEWVANRLWWSFPEEKRREWYDLSTERIKTCRDIARRAGMLNWIAYVTGSHCHPSIVDEHIRIARMDQAVWDEESVTQCSQKAEEIFQSELRKWSTKRRFTWEAEDLGRRLVIIADASTEAGGHIVLNWELERFDHVPDYSRRWTSSLAGDSTKIFYLEFIAVIGGVYAAVDSVRHMNERLDILIVTDNLGLKYTINRGCSNLTSARTCFAAIPHGVRLRATWIPTEENPADGLTRATQSFTTNEALLGSLKRRLVHEMHHMTFAKCVEDPETRPGT
jgi:hypothetical protein